MLSVSTPRPQAGFHSFHQSLRALALAPAFAALGIAAPVFLAPAGAAPLPLHAHKTLTVGHKALSKACAGPNDVTLDFVAADINDVLKALSMQTHVNIVSGADVKGTVTVSLAHVTLEDALDLVTRLSGYQYAKIGRTYVIGTPQTIANLTAEGRASAPVETAVVPYLYSDAEDVSGIIKQLIPTIQITPGKTTGGQGGVLIVSGTEAQLTQVRQVVAQSEAALSKNIASSETVVYNIKYASAEDLQSVLGRLVPGLVVTPAPTQGFNLHAPITAESTGTTSTTTSYGAVPAGGAVTSTVGSVALKPTTSSLLLTGSAGDIARARQLLATVDLRPAQINYEAKVTEINLNNVKRIGLTYDFNGASTQIGEALGNKPDGTPRNSPTDIYGDPYPGRVTKFKTFVRSPITNLVTVGLDALYQTGDAKLLSQPNISALDGQPAATFIGDNITYISSITNSPTGQNITTATVSAGIKLFVTGKVNNDGYITLNIHPEVSSVIFQPSIGGATLPDITTREATTTLRVRDGETIAIGGLISDTDIKNINKVPILGDLPFFGQLFRDTQHTRRHNEVVIFIKVSIQKDAA